MAARKKSDDERYIKLTVTMPPALRAQLQAYCDKHERQLSWVIAKALSEWLESTHRQDEQASG